MAHSNDMATNATSQARYWLLTIPEAAWSPPSELPPGICYLRGQLEVGESNGFRHWQALVAFKTKKRLRGVKEVFGRECHAEPGRSNAARDYVWKEDTRVAGTQFELGRFAVRRSESTDWDLIRDSAKKGNLDSIPSDVYIRYYGNIKRIMVDNLQPISVVRTCYVFWGGTGLGKSRRAWEEAGLEAYSKDPRSKWWCGYQGQCNVIIDEFRGDIDVSHLLRWLDRYPVIVETKGAALPLGATHFWITSNISPREWYPMIDEGTKAALLRRLTITHFDALQ